MESSTPRPDTSQRALQAKVDEWLKTSTVTEEASHIPGRHEWEKLYPTNGDVKWADIKKCNPKLVRECP